MRYRRSHAKLVMILLPCSDNVPKSYAFVGMLPPDMNHKISEYQSIPVVYHVSIFFSNLRLIHTTLQYTGITSVGEARY